MTSASITLHSPFLDFNDPQSLSTNRCIHAADAILDVYYTLNKAALSLPTSDFPHLLKLHPFVTVSRSILPDFGSCLNGLYFLIDLLVPSRSSKGTDVQIYD